MIEQVAVVETAGDGYALIRPLTPGNCPRCAEGRGCGSRVLAQAIGGRRAAVLADCRVAGLRQGDRVIVGIEGSALIQASLLAWMVPLLLMFAAGTFAVRLLQATDILAAAFGMTGLLAGLLWVRWRVDGLDAQRFRPVVLRRDERKDVLCPRWL